MIKKVHHWKIGTINVHTAKEDKKLEKVTQKIGKAALLICGLQEVRRIKSGSALITSTVENTVIIDEHVIIDDFEVKTMVRDFITSLILTSYLF